MSTTSIMTKIPNAVAQRTRPMGAVNIVTFPGRTPVDWLQVPAFTPPKTERIHRSRWATESSRSVWMQSQDNFDFELLSMGVLAVIAALGIIYGFSCLVQLVQHWALFNLMVGNLIQ